MWPVFTRMSENRLEVVDRHKCTHVLVGVEEDTMTWQGNDIMYAGQECVRTCSYGDGGTRAHYIKMNKPVSLLPPIVKQRLSAAYSMVGGYVYGDKDELASVRQILKPLKQNYKHDVKFSIRSLTYKKSATTGEHHTHYTPMEVYNIVTCDARRRQLVLSMNARLRQMHGITEAFAATILMYIATARESVAVMIATSSTLWARNVDLTLLRLKECSVPFKSLHHADLIDLTEMFELLSLANRGYGAVDWRAEKEHRTKVDDIKVKSIDVYRSAMKIFEMGNKNGFRYKKLSIKDFTASRWEWAPAGSVHSQHEDDRVYIDPSNYRHRTKFVTLNSMPARHIETFLEREPEIQAWPSEKIEWGKRRAIYGVDLTSATLAHLAMYNCEDVFRHRFPVGKEAEASRVHKRLRAMCEGEETFCYDFDDFNAQHSTDAMIAVLCAYRDKYAADMSAVQREAMDWTIASQTKTIVNAADGRYRTAGTLMSGSRLTTFLNTALNFIYMDIAGVFATPGFRDSVHNGDDVLLTVESMSTACSIHAKMAAINARAQAAKCNAFSIGEFLRVEHKLSKQTGNGAQYLTRACATTVHSRIESQAPVKLTSMLGAYRNRQADIEARAFIPDHVKDAMVKHVINKASTVFTVPKETVEAIYHAHVVVGGVSTDSDASVGVEFEEHPAQRIFEDEDGKEKQLLPGIIDYSDLLASKYEGMLSDKVVFSAVMRATRNQLAVTREVEIRQISTPARGKFGLARSLYKLYKNVLQIPFVSQARFLGVPPISLATPYQAHVLKRVVGNVQDPLRALRILL
ncbi:RNA dependent RNA polymerase [Red clover powdery mildew-associated totivirus 1]|uniref:RNA-directed RNA polymerase n=1 Tax=Red clover powdery mildew-associated totivirus 1 TaxID=1714362 RepID=A0A0S3Q2B2_9VIRU|nr:RNA dependent RNA polymerase [Red clover powdery mildew-associated totivirus 1]BAT62476.1 RNA dependent RNA polymerase [Red clover powdery mildew-associated totivirus 1]